MRIVADRNICVGAGMCVLTAPALFDQDDEGLVSVIGSVTDASTAQAAEDAASGCPSGALSVSQT